MLIGLLILVGVCFLASTFLLGGDDEDAPSYTPQAYATEPAISQAIATNTPKPFIPPTVSADGQTWLVMLYQDADDKILEEDIYVDLNEAERVGSSERVHIVAQVDRYSAGYRGDGNWTTARRYYITQDDDLGVVKSQQVADLGEVDMSAGQTLVDFVTWAVETIAADRYVLILSDHGTGWPGGWSDPSPGGAVDRSIPLTSAMGGQLYLMELDAALQQIRSETDIGQFELIGMDACLMSHLEVYSALAPHARYAVASQETEPALGWAYTGFLQALQRNPDMTGAELGQMIVESYIDDDQRIQDDQARADLLRQGSPLGGLYGLMGGPTAEEVAQQMGQDSTLTAVDLGAIPALIDSVNELAYRLQDVRQPAVARARNYAQSFTNVFDPGERPSYLDLGNLAGLLKKETSSSSVSQAVDAVLASLDDAVIAEKHGSKKPGASGISIYFPNSGLYQSPLTGPESYTAIASRFAGDSLWDDFLAYHYTGRTFEPAAGSVAVPDRETAITAPGAGQIEISPLQLSDKVAAPGQPVLLSADIRGQNIGYVYLLVSYYDRESNSIYVIDRDYLESDVTREIDGVYYPDWGEDVDFTMEFEWEPVVFAISDGVDYAVALFTPHSYGASFEEATYTVDGIYTYADDGESRYARLYFSDGVLRQVFGFANQKGAGAPREIVPQAGDTFTVLESWMDLDDQGQLVEVATQEGDTLTFQEQTFTWEELDAAAGEYVVGFVVEDLDGNAYTSSEAITVD